MAWWHIAIWVVTAIISYALRPKIQQPKPAGLSDINIPTAEDGREIPVLFGMRDIDGPNVVWYGDLRTAPVKKKSRK